MEALDPFECHLECGAWIKLNDYCSILRKNNCKIKGQIAPYLDKKCYVLFSVQRINTKSCNYPLPCVLVASVCLSTLKEQFF